MNFPLSAWKRGGLIPLFVVPGYLQARHRGNTAGVLVRLHHRGMSDIALSVAEMPGTVEPRDSLSGPPLLKFNRPKGHKEKEKRNG